jgi:hypothetical protein
MRNKFVKIVSVVKENLLIRPAGIIIMYMESVSGTRGRDWEQNVLLVPVRSN